MQTQAIGKKSMAAAAREGGEEKSRFSFRVREYGVVRVRNKDRVGAGSVGEKGG